MLNTNLLQTLGMAMVLSLPAACSTTSSGGDTSLADSSAPETNDSTVSFESCPGACATVKSCDKRIDVTACEAQCHKELLGQGYLDLEIAKPYFENLAGLTSDAGCNGTFHGPWWNGAYPDEFKVTVLHPELLEQCATTRSHCGLTLNQARAVCFYSYYFFNQDYRTKIAACFSEKDCTVQETCMCTNAPGSRAWVTIPPDPNISCN